MSTIRTMWVVGIFEGPRVNEKARDKVLKCEARVQKDTRQNSLVLLRDQKAGQATEKARKSPSMRKWKM